MGQKINPLGFRLGTTQNHYSIWFKQPKKYCEGLQEDQKIRDCITNYIDNQRVSRVDAMTDCISRIQIEKGIDGVKVTIYMGKPQFLTEDKPPKSKELKGKKSQKEKKRKELNETRIKELKGNVEKVLHCENQKLKISIRKIRKPYGDPKIIAEFLANQLKSRISFRKAMQKTIELAADKEEGCAKGIQVQIAGRIEGKEIARVEWLRKGRVSLQTIRTKIHFCSTTVRTIHGVLGIKIWVSK
uniref:Small ribosomal subunit protein uS3c n=1 Tax=Erodium texanum TaxID=28960 RepID=B7T321_EROTE|nr:ribosomal protein S3 [Erodium texanum]ACH47266.1 ribosomal protein S3 [Erodium texanum]ADJ66290.1 ribosomal protein S3 [Erodium texanum]